jgi:hypothetical protein
MKLVEVPKEKVRKIVPEISRYANRQNAVSEADLTANDPFNVALEELAQTTAVIVAGANPKYWTYERAKGAYMNMLAEAGSEAKRKKLKERFPTNQKFTKTDMAKYYNSWERRPWRVSQGAAKNYAAFMGDIEAGLIPEKPDIDFFHQLIAKAILFKQTDTLVRREDFGGYKAEIVTYTLAYISHRLRGQLDWEKIWQTQQLSEEWQEAIQITCRSIQKFIISQAAGTNLREFCKKESSWEEAKNLNIDFAYAGLLDVKFTLPKNTEKNEDTELNDLQEVALAWIRTQLDPNHVEQLALWMEEEESGAYRERQFVPQMVPKIRLHKEITPKQAAWLAKIWDRAEKNGWTPT